MIKELIVNLNPIYISKDHFTFSCVYVCVCPVRLKRCIRTVWG